MHSLSPWALPGGFWQTVPDAEQDRGFKHGCLSTTNRKQPWHNHHSALTLHRYWWATIPNTLRKVYIEAKIQQGPGICYSHKFYATVQCQFWLLQLLFMVSVWQCPFCSLKPNTHSHITESISWRNAGRLGLSSSLGLSLWTTNLEEQAEGDLAPKHRQVCC